MADARSDTTTPGAKGTADALVAAAGADALEAIRLLTDANRRQGDPSIETLLVRLRRDAFAALDRSAPAVPMAPVQAAPPEPGPLPALPRDQLSPGALRAGFARHGCVYVPGFVPPELVARLVDGIDRALAACDAGLAGAPVSETEPWFAPFDAGPGQYRVGGRRTWMRASGGVWTADSPRMLFELIEVLEQLGVGALVRDYLGERPALSANKCNLRRTPPGECGAWHQDGAFLGTGVRSVNFWLALDDCGRDAPGLDVVPRRLDAVVETGTDGAIFDWAVAPAVAERAAGPVGILRPEFGPGDALFFDHLFLHRTAASPGMPRERHAIETWFFAPSAYPEGQIPLVY